MSRNSSHSAPPSIRGLHILVVDDNKDGLLLLSTILEMHGARVSAAGSVAEAMMVFEKGSPDIIVSDIAMPYEDGYVFIRKVRALPPQKGGTIPAIAMTGYASEEDRRRVLGAGFQAYVTRPFDPDTVVVIINSLIQR